MIASFPLKDREALRALFAVQTVLRGMVESCLAGEGEALSDRPHQPSGAVMTCGDFALCGGVCGPWAAHLLRAALGTKKRAWIVYGPPSWHACIARTTGYAQGTRWAFDHSAQPKDERLHSLMSTHEGVNLITLEGEWIARCRREEWSRDFVSGFQDDEDFARRGVGVLALQDGRMVAGASSYVAYPGGVEAQVQTRADCFRQGLATAASAAMILRAHAMGLRVSWDAANLASARLAEKLGYRPLGPYTVFLAPET